MRFGNKKGGTVLIIIVALLLLMGLAGAGGYLYITKFQRQTGPTKSDLPHVNMTQDVIRFSFNTLPELYAKMVEINREIDLIHTEVARLETLSSEYPQQKSIINTEKVIWEKTLKSLFSVLQNFEKNIETIYVAYAVNEVKGKELIDSSAPTLLAAAEEAIAASRAETARIRVEAPKTLMEKLKSKLTK